MHTQMYTHKCTQHTCTQTNEHKQNCCYMLTNKAFVSCYNITIQLYRHALHQNVAATVSGIHTKMILAFSSCNAIINKILLINKFYFYDLKGIWRSIKVDMCQNSITTQLFSSIQSNLSQNVSTLIHS